MRIRTRLLLGLLVIFAAGAYFLLDPILDRLEQQYLEAVEEPMVDTANILAEMVERDVKGGTISVDRLREAFAHVAERSIAAKIYDVLKTKVEMRVYVTDSRGIVLFDSDGPANIGADYSKLRDVSLTLRGDYGARSSQGEPGDSLSSIMFVGAPIRDNAGRIIGVLSVGKPQKSVEEFIAVSRWKIIAGAVGTGAVLALAAWLLSHWVTTPIRRLTDYANEIKSGRRVPFPKLAGVEVKTLGRAFEEMRDALEGRRYAEDYIRTLTHEIKSPLSAIRGAAELLGEDMPRDQQDKFLGNIKSQTERIQRIIDQLLQLSTVERQKALTRPAPIAVEDLLLDVMESMRDAAAARGVQLRAAGNNNGDAGVPGSRPTQLTVSADRELLEIAFKNLVQNAIEFSPRGATVTLTARPTLEKQAVEIVVEDEGAGVPDYALGRVFDRFYSLQRPGTNEKSSGLGLCFVKEIAELHGGRVTLENRQDGVGARAILRLNGS